MIDPNASCESSKDLVEIIVLVNDEEVITDGQYGTVANYRILQAVLGMVFAADGRFSNLIWTTRCF